MIITIYFYLSEFFKDIWHVHSQTKFDSMTITPRYNKNLFKIIHMKDVKNVHFAQQ